MKCLFQRIQDETGMRRPAGSPANDPPGIGIDNEGDVNEARPGGDICEIRHPQPIGRGRIELPIDVIERARRGLVADRGAYWFASDHTLKAQFTHQPLDGAAGDGETLPPHLSPDLANTVHFEVLGEHARNRGLEILIAPRPRGQAIWILSLGNMLVVGGWGDRQNPADRLDPIGCPVIIDKRDHRLNGRSSCEIAPNNDPAPEVSQRVDLVGKHAN